MKAFLLAEYKHLEVTEQPLPPLNDEDVLIQRVASRNGDSQVSDEIGTMCIVPTVPRRSF